ncbi:Hypothetical protein FKW44_022619 [Caligus rogercresseyi]|uniref:Uncharacterized protein n=1 Tax=Caligus rogercresseyi TaxID=217165 RepID=A0A7T8JU41_CALRO|nr:Hypothetical protein FKW44_022619 [Caligus rogercresseyi]
MVRMATELKRVAEEWDPLMSRSLQFSNVMMVACRGTRILMQRRKKSDNSCLSLCSSPEQTHLHRGLQKKRTLQSAVRMQRPSLKSSETAYT